jgi:hypothetical protein
VKLPNFKASFITENFFAHVPKHRINKGHCFAWSYIAYHLFEGVEIWDTDNHAFVKYKGKFYDSDRPNGEKDWKDLPACNFGQTPYGRELVARCQPLEEFKDLWAGNPEQYGYTWDMLETVALETLEQGGYQ